MRLGLLGRFWKEFVLFEARKGLMLLQCDLLKQAGPDLCRTCFPSALTAVEHLESWRHFPSHLSRMHVPMSHPCTLPVPDCRVWLFSPWLFSPLAGWRAEGFPWGDEQTVLQDSSLQAFHLSLCVRLLGRLTLDCSQYLRICS